MILSVSFYLLQAFIPVKEIPRLFQNQNPVEGYQVKDNIRGMECGTLVVVAMETFEWRHEKTDFVPMRKQRRRLAAQEQISYFNSSCTYYTQNFKLLAFFCDSTS